MFYFETPSVYPIWCCIIPWSTIKRGLYLYSLTSGNIIYPFNMWVFLQQVVFPWWKGPGISTFPVTLSFEDSTWQYACSCRCMLSSVVVTCYLVASSFPFWVHIAYNNLCRTWLQRLNFIHNLLDTSGPF